MKDFFFKPGNTGEGLYKDKGSKFLAFAYPVETDEDIESLLESIRKKYHDARHHCYAWIRGFDGGTYRANDDGEPSHSAGDPILGQIRSRELTNTLVVVVRYFGGTKLGVGGLINAYKTSASDALDQAGITKVPIKSKFRLTYNYEQTNQVMQFISNKSLQILSQKFESNCSLIVSVIMSRKDEIKSELSTLQDRGLLVQYEQL